MDPIDLLTRQHRHVENLFDRFVRLPPSDVMGRTAVFAQICEDIALHTALEEEHVYPLAAMLRRPDAQEEALAEHEGLKEALADLLQTDVEDPAFEPKLIALRDNLELHVEAEESELFPLLEARLGEAELEALGARMLDEAARSTEALA